MAEIDQGSSAGKQIAGGTVGAAKGAIGGALIGMLVVAGLFSGGVAWLLSGLGTTVATVAGVGAFGGAFVIPGLNAITFGLGTGLAALGGGLGFLDGAAKGNAEHSRGQLVGAQQQAYDMEMSRLMQARGAEMQVRMTEAQAMQQQIAFAREAMAAEQAAQKPKALGMARTGAAIDMEQGAGGAWAQKVADKNEGKYADNLPTMTAAQSHVGPAADDKVSQGVAFELAASQVAAVQPTAARV